MIPGPAEDEIEMRDCLSEEENTQDDDDHLFDLAIINAIEEIEAELEEISLPKAPKARNHQFAKLRSVFGSISQKLNRKKKMFKLNIFKTPRKDSEETIVAPKDPRKMHAF